MDFTNLEQCQQLEHLFISKMLPIPHSYIINVLAWWVLKLLYA